MLNAPPFLLGVALLFWGAQTGMPVFGGVMALAVELSRWMRVRIDFSLLDMGRIWDFCSLLTVVAGLYCVMTNDSINDVMLAFQSLNFSSRSVSALQLDGAAKVFFQWWPILLFPAVLAQAYGPHDRLPATVYSILHRRRMRREGKEPVPGSGVNFAYPYVGVCLYAASLTKANEAWFFWGFAGVCFWGLYGVRTRRFGISVWSVLAGLLIFAGFVGQREFPRVAAALESQVVGMFWQWLRNRNTASEMDTTIGDVGDMKGSGGIVMRIKSVVTPPALLPESVYCRFDGEGWDNPMWINFEDMTSLQDGETWVLNEAPDAAKSITVARHFGSGLVGVPKPVSTAMIRDLPVGKFRTNWLGTVRAGSGVPFIVYRAVYGSSKEVELPPMTMIDQRIAGPDIMIPEAEDVALEGVSKEIGTDWRHDPADIVKAVERFFAEKFEYSLNDEPGRSQPGARGKTLIGAFLSESRKGHCEYFATATVLLLRHHGIPARYVLGWSIQEPAEIPGDYVVRGRHAHAWVRYWSAKEGRWQDLDTTPPASFAADSATASIFEPFNDWWSERMHAFRMWRYYGGDNSWQAYLFGALLILLSFPAWRILARRRRRIAAGTDLAAYAFARLGLDSEFYEITKRLTAAGAIRHAGETLEEWRRRMEKRPEWREGVAEILGLHYRYRFDPAGITEADRRRLRDAVRSWLDADVAVATR